MNNRVEQDLIGLIGKWTQSNMPPGEIAAGLGTMLGTFIRTAPPQVRVWLELTALCEFYNSMGRPDRAAQLRHVAEKAAREAGVQHGQTTH